MSFQSWFPLFLTTEFRAQNHKLRDSKSQSRLFGDWKRLQFQRWSIGHLPCSHLLVRPSSKILQVALVRLISFSNWQLKLPTPSRRELWPSLLVAGRTCAPRTHATLVQEKSPRRLLRWVSLQRSSWWMLVISTLKNKIRHVSNADGALMYVLNYRKIYVWS